MLMLGALFAVALAVATLVALMRRWRLSERQRAYRAYLQTDGWKRLRREALERDGRRCRLCNSAGDLQVHHRYYPAVWGTETQDALTTLCGRCHDEVAHRDGRW
jgi:5-methylcytosine-specific restriction endonuclease McrA